MADDEQKTNFLFQWRKAIVSKDGPKSWMIRFVLGFLSFHMDKDGGSCYPSTRTLAIETGLSRRTVETYLKKAESEGWIKKEFAGLSGQGWKRHKYTPLIPEKVAHVMSHVTQKGGEPHAKGGEPDDIKVAQDVPTRSSTSSLKRSTGKKNKKKVSIPENYHLENRHIEYAKSKGIPKNCIPDIFEDFCIYHSKEGKKFLNWYAAWQTWVKNELKFHPDKYQNEQQGAQRTLTDEEIYANPTRP